MFIMQIKNESQDSHSVFRYSIQLITESPYFRLRLCTNQLRVIMRAFIGFCALIKGCNYPYPLISSINGPSLF